MITWLRYLKSGLSRKLPTDHFNKKVEYTKLRYNLKYIYPSIIEHWKPGVINLVLTLLTSLLAFPLPIISKYFIDDVLQKKKLELVFPVIGLMVLISVMTYLFGLLKQFYSMRFTQEVILHLQTRLMTKILALPKFFFDKNRSGYLMSRITNDVGGVNWFISGTVVNLFIQGIRFVGGLGFLFFLEWRLALPVLFTLPFPLIVTKYFAKRSYIMSHYNSELTAETHASLQETVATVPLIKAFATEKRSLEILVGMLKKKIDFGYEQNSIGNLNSTINSILPSITKLAVLVFGAIWVIKGEWELGSLFAFQAYLGYVYGPVNSLSGSINSLQSARATLERLASIFEMDSEENVEEGKKVKRLNGAIEFRNISFAYESSKPVLTDLSFKINPGENCAVIGSSGVGKTTLVSLILRFYKPHQGNIYYDNIVSNEYNVRALRRRFGYVAQSTSLQMGTIMDILKYGNQNATDNEVKKATRIAEIADFIENLPEKYNTVIEENGSNLSEGQKQRLSIARALVRNPDVLILDEPTSAIDNVTENSIIKALPESVKNKTTITIAHRLNTIKSADKIIFLRKNKPALIGTQSELMNHTDYQEFYEEL